ncbi:WD repeat domain phosphoinositide-interacting protein 4-like [Corticium candelabrum]|uniref:WD repeat domain phosphoinositide-interacting protein 4-like n=1 Tax=Corticium candelabrum TaxID=121492 RepID=UPI002E274F57|nr:WD repeat domain phosphoinositide-interacting protein 4-like [Corticium candelabrum]
MERRSGIVELRMNQEQSCFVCGTDNGISVFNLDPLMRKTRVDFDEVGSVSRVEMLHRTNIIAFIGGGQAPKFGNKQVLVWDDVKKKVVLQFTFEAPVKSVRLTLDRLVAVLEHKLYIYSFPNSPRLLKTIDRVGNTLGLCEISMSHSKQLMAFPGFQPGQLEIMDLRTIDSHHATASSTIIAAHKTSISFITFNRKGTRVATASIKGTLIRVFSTTTKELETELRRGSDTALFYSISFSNDDEYLCASSDKGTIHIFALKDRALNKRSTFRAVGFIAPYVDSQWGLAQFSVPPESKCLCGFTAKNSVYAICANGTFHQYKFTKSGSCSRESFDVFTDIGFDQDLDI